MDIKYSKDTSITNGINLEIGVWYTPDLAPKDGSWFAYITKDKYIDFAYFDKDRNNFFCTDVSDEAEIYYWCLLPPINNKKYWRHKKYINDSEDTILVINYSLGGYLWAPYDLARKDYLYTPEGDFLKTWCIDDPFNESEFELFYEFPKIPE